MEQLSLSFQNNIGRASGLNLNRHLLSECRQSTPPQNPINPDTDCGLIFSYLLNKGWVNIIDIMRDLKPGCINWAVRSRIPDLKNKFLRYNMPYRIENRIGENGQAEYKLVKL